MDTSATAIRTTPRWRRRKDTRPTEILDAALEIYGERGYESARLEDIARRAGCTKGTVFLYYANKSELFKAAVRSAMMPVVTEAERLVAEHRGTARELLAAVLRLRWNHMARIRLSGMVKLLLAGTGEHPELARFYNDEFIERNQRLLRQVLQMGVDRGEFRPLDVTNVARVVIAPMLFATVWRQSYEQAVNAPLELDTYFEAALDLLLAGIAVNAPVPAHG